MRIVYCGELWSGSTCLMRLEALRALGHAVVGVDTTFVPQGLRGLACRALRKAGWETDPVGVNSNLLRAVSTEDPELVWVDKGLSILPKTLARIRNRGIRLVHYSPDDMSNPRNQSSNFLVSVPLYDLHVTTKSYNVSERRAMGAREVFFVNNAYCATLHRPLMLSDEERFRYGGKVGFIGAFEKDRAEALWFLASHGVPVRVWGDGWRRWADRLRHPLLRVENAWIWGEDYVKGVCSFDINLGFLRKVNRDLQTTRSIEIPACCAFLLAERTIEHQQLFSEGVEAEFFESREELLEKCRFYLSHPEKRAGVAMAGYRRCLDSDYSYTGHMAAALQHLEGLELSGVRKLRSGSPHV